MAFVNSSPSKYDFKNRTSSDNLGPGQYDIDSTEHKNLMAVLRPKKTAPFNASAQRTFHKNDAKDNKPGPGAYESKVGIFEKQASLSGMRSKDKFFTQDNGHINMRMQQYSTIKTNVTQIQMNKETAINPGPAHYSPHNTSTSVGLAGRFSPKQRGSGAIINPITVVQAVSPGRAAAAVSNPSLQKMSVPSIPSRFLTPVIDANTQNNDDQEICKMSRLVDDPSRVGPGTYLLVEEQTRKQPTATIPWNRSRSTRTSELVEPFKNTGASVGPGSYTVKGQFYKPNQPFFNRDGMKPVKVSYDKGTIKNNFEYNGDHESEDEGEMKRRKTSPGPGAYQTMSSSFGDFMSPQARPASISIFGSTVSRFQEKPIGTRLGPGEYRPKVIGKLHNSALAVAGSAAFKSQKRPDIINYLAAYDRPCPGEYNKQQLNKTFTAAIKKIGKKDQTSQFISKKKRFDADDTLPPGPGQYVAANSCMVKEPKHAGATYRSKTKRELGDRGDTHKQHILNKNPGVGAYDLTGFNSTGGQTLQGGGAPNNFTICYKDMNPTIRKVDPRPSPRISETITYTPNALGPGAYTIDPSSKNVEDKYKPSKLPKKESNWASLDRFRGMQPQTQHEIGPGSYKTGQKWTKRTYNLKFLDANKQRKSSQSPNQPLARTLAQNSSPTMQLHDPVSVPDGQQNLNFAQ